MGPLLLWQAVRSARVLPVCLLVVRLLHLLLRLLLAIPRTATPLRRLLSKRWLRRLL